MYILWRFECQKFVGFLGCSTMPTNRSRNQPKYMPKTSLLPYAKSRILPPTHCCHQFSSNLSSLYGLTQLILGNYLEIWISWLVVVSLYCCVGYIVAMYSSLLFDGLLHSFLDDGLDAAEKVIAACGLPSRIWCDDPLYRGSRLYCSVP